MSAVLRVNPEGGINGYLIRKAGRFDLRLIWRSLSKQILVELVSAL